MFAHAVLARKPTAPDQNEAIIRGLVELLIEREVVDRRGAGRGRRRCPRGDTTSAIAIRVDDEGSELVGTPVDCAARMHVCKAVCCRLRFPLTVEEVESAAR